MTRRAQFYPQVDAETLILGVNSNSALTAPDLDAAVDLGASIIRIHPGWDGVENYATGALALPSATVTALGLMAARNLTPMVVTGYGPPRSTIATMTLAAQAEIDATTITVVEAVTSVDVPYCHIQKGDGTQITSRRAYYGSFIRAVDTATKTLTLASPLTVQLAAASTVKINRVRYPTVTSVDPTEASTVSFLRYLAFVADEVDRLCGGGYVCLWNEAPWVNDPWCNRRRFYAVDADADADGVPAAAGQDTCLGLLKGVVTLGMPATVEVINGASDLSGFATGTNRSVYSDPAVQVPRLAWDGIHPYGDNPERHAWYPDETDASYGANWFQTVSPIYQTSNFRYAARQHDLFRASNGTAPRLAATECGAYLADNTLHARHILRRVLSLWAMNVSMVVLYALAEGDTFRLMDPGDLNRRPAFAAIQRMIAARDAGAGGTAPGVLGWSGVQWDLMMCRAGSTVFAWQRTEHATDWTTVVSPAAATLTLSGGDRVVSATNLLSGASVAYVVTGNRVAVPIADDPVAIRFT